MTERILQLYNYVYKQTSSCIESCTVQLWWFHYFLSPLQKALTFLFWSWTWDGSFLILLVLVCIYTCSLWRMYIKQIWSKDNQKRNWHNIPYNHDETNSCVDYLWWRQVPRPPRFLFLVCIQYNTRKQKRGEKQGRPGCEVDVREPATTKINQFLTGQPEYLQSCERLGSCQVTEHLTMMSSSYLNADPSSLCPPCIYLTSFMW